MEALSAIAPLVLVLRGSIMGTAASLSAPEPVPHLEAPAQIAKERAIARVEIVNSVVVQLTSFNFQRELRVNGYRLFVRNRGGSVQSAMGMNLAPEIIVDLP